MALEAFESTVRSLFSQGWTYERISTYIQQLTGVTRGFSCRSVRRFCQARGLLRRHTLGENALDQCVRMYVLRVGHAYGRRTMQGLLRSNGIEVSQRRIAAALRRVAPVQYCTRRIDAYRMLNPFPYHASYFGEKLHLDQNEKIAMYGVTHIIAVDGYSRKITGFITLPVKNAIAIYDLLMRPLLLTEGLWEQMRVDHGREFALIISVQQSLANLRQTYSHSPVLQSTSRQNHRVERLWPEVNQRINFPIKTVLIEMEANGEIDMSNEITKFCVSSVSIMVISRAIDLFVSSWNCHRIPGRNGGIPNMLAQNATGITRLSSFHVPTTTEAVSSHEVNGSRLTRESCFGCDPLRGHENLQRLRYRDFRARYHDMHMIFQGVLHGSPQMFRSAIAYHIELTNSFASLL